MLGGWLGLGAPVGLVIVRLLTDAPIAMVAYVTFGTIVAMAAFGWVIGRKEDQLEELTLVDALTGIGNRRKFDMRLREELARASRTKDDLALLIIDIDRFKAVNDRWGHLAGDRVLRQIAGLVLDTFRATDIVCRYGGEEIAVIAPDTNLEEASVLAERIRERIAATPLEIPGADATITISVGITAWEGEPPALADEVTARADSALYDAKREGRNRCRISEVIEAAVLH